MKIVAIVGARPQFIKAAPVSKALRKAGHQEILVHTGQHYDYGMSKVFFEELDLAEPDTNLGVGSGTHAWQIGEMLMRIEKVLLAEKPDWVLVYGDTNSTLAGALASAKLRIPLAHVEAGLRSFNREMPEEHNRVLTDHCSDLLFCPTQIAVDNLQKEGFRNIINDGKLLDESFFENGLSALSFELSPLVVNVGDTMYDAVLQFSGIALRRSTILQDLGLKAKGYFLATVHRPYNTDNPKNLHNILNAFGEIEEPIIFSVHPRTRKKIAESGFDNPKSEIQNLKLIDPVGYLDMLVLEQHAKLILTDSGGMQKEAYFFGVPCVTLRPETEWVETVEAGWNMVVGANRDTIVKAVEGCEERLKVPSHLFGDGSASEQILRLLQKLG
jgi:UDP-GlcNAc3NAcA epimerase